MAGLFIFLVIVFFSCCSESKSLKDILEDFAEAYLTFKKTSPIYNLSDERQPLMPVQSEQVRSAKVITVEFLLKVASLSINFPGNFKDVKELSNYLYEAIYAPVLCQTQFLHDVPLKM